jgi:hypothetical protein
MLQSPGLMMSRMPAASRWYAITHAGLDAMMQRFINDIEQFALLPPDNQTVDAQR